MIADRWGELVLNALFRGVFEAPPTTLYASVSYSTTAPYTELAGMTRLEVPMGGYWTNWDAAYGYSSSSTTRNGNAYMRTVHGLTIPTSAGESTQTLGAYTILFYDQPTGGRLCFVAGPSYATSQDSVTITTPTFIGGTVGAIYTGSLFGALTGGDVLSLQIRYTGSAGAGSGVLYGHKMILDYLLCGINTFETQFPTNYAMGTFVTTSSMTNTPYSDTYGNPRDTVTWSAPALDAATQKSYIVNTADIYVGPIKTGFAMSAGTNHYLSWTINDNNYVLCSTPNVRTDVTAVAGDFVKFAPGSLTVYG